MKRLLLAAILLAPALMSSDCFSKDAEDAANGPALSPTTINGTWKHGNSGLVLRISNVTSSGMGSGVIVSVGSAMPSGAQGGTSLKEVEYIRGGYWEAINQSYMSNGTWQQGSVIGLAISESNINQFKIGSQVYTRQ